jgi:hypothetical protein
MLQTDSLSPKTLLFVLFQLLKQAMFKISNKRWPQKQQVTIAQLRFINRISALQSKTRRPLDTHRRKQDS